MIPSLFPAVNPGQQLSADLVNQIMALLQQLSGVTDGSDLQQFTGGGIAGGAVIDLRRPFIARISDIIPPGNTSQDEMVLRYELREQTFADTMNGFADLEFGIRTSYAYEANGRNDVNKETIVLAFPGMARFDETQEYIFFCGCDAGYYRGSMNSNCNCCPQGSIDFVSDVCLIQDNNTTLTTSSSMTLGLGNRNVLVAGATGTVTITLPPAAAAFDHVNGTGFEYMVKRGEGLAQTVIVAPAGSDTIEFDDGGPNVTLADDTDWVRVVSDGVSKWSEL